MGGGHGDHGLSMGCYPGIPCDRKGGSDTPLCDKCPYKNGPDYHKLLANRSWFAATYGPDAYYLRETWTPLGGSWPDPVGWRRNSMIALGVSFGIMGAVWYFSPRWEVYYRPPLAWVPSMMWNENIPQPVDLRGRLIDIKTGKPVQKPDEQPNASQH